MADQRDPTPHSEAVTSQCQDADKQNTTATPASDDAPYTVLSERQKVTAIVIASCSAFVSPVSATIYFPALNSLASDMNVSSSKINLSITMYLIFQGIAPSFVGNSSDMRGRRPALLICFVIYIGANIGLALQNSYPALMVLRCLQSSGSSGTIIISGALTADLITRAERGKYLAYSSMGNIAGQALGPVVGGLLNQFLGWQAIFWFLTIVAGVMMTVVVCFLPETSRNVVGNGSMAPQKWNRCVMDIVRPRWNDSEKEATERDQNEVGKKKSHRPGFLQSFVICFQKETGIILIFTALIFCGYTTILSTLPSQLEKKYGFNSLQIGLCCIPYAFGSLTSRWTVGYLIDWNFRRHAQRLGFPITKNRQTDMTEFPAEIARLQLTLPLLSIAVVFVVMYSWVMAHQTNLAGPLIMMALAGHVMAGAINTLITLLVDCHVGTPGTAMAANNLSRCLLGAGAVAVAVPLINAVGIGWAGTVLALLWTVMSPLLWLLIKRGHAWRREMVDTHNQG